MIGMLPPVRTGVLGGLAQMLPPSDGAQIFAPTMTSMNITNECNASCPMCLEDANGKGFEPFSVEEASAVLAQVAELKLHEETKNLHLWGGEPFLDPEQLFGIVSEADRLGFEYVSIATNGSWGADEGRARELLSRLSDSAKRARLTLELSCDRLHNAQRLLSPRFLANILYLTETEFNHLGRSINHLLLKDDSSIGALCAALQEKPPAGRVAFFGSEYGRIFVSPDGQPDAYGIRVVQFSPSMSGRCSEGLKDLFELGPLTPDIMSLLNIPLDNQISIGIDRQFYCCMYFCSPGVLPMGSTWEYSIRELVARTNADPIAASLMRVGYAEIYPKLKQIFDIDARLGRFFLPYDVLKGLELEQPFVGAAHAIGAR